MKRSTEKHLQAMGIILMTGITLGSIAPSANAFKNSAINPTAQASRVRHHRHHRAHHARHVRRRAKRHSLSRAQLKRIYNRSMTKSQKRHKATLKRLQHKYALAMRKTQSELARLNTRIQNDERKMGRKHVRKYNHANERKLRAEVRANKALIMHVEKAHLIKDAHLNAQLKRVANSNRSLQGQIRQDHLVMNQLRKVRHNKKIHVRSNRLNAVLASLNRNNQKINGLQKSLNTYKATTALQGKQLANAKKSLAQARHQKVVVKKQVVHDRVQYKHNQVNLNALNRSINNKVSKAVSKATANQRAYDSKVISGVSHKYESQLSNDNASNRKLINKLRDSHAKDEAKIAKLIKQESDAQKRAQAFITASNKKAEQMSKLPGMRIKVIHPTTHTVIKTVVRDSNSGNNTNSNSATNNTTSTNGTVTPKAVMHFSSDIMEAQNDSKKIQHYASGQKPQAKKAIKQAVSRNDVTNDIIKHDGDNVAHASVNDDAISQAYGIIMSRARREQNTRNKEKAQEAALTLQNFENSHVDKSKKDARALRKQDKKDQEQVNKDISKEVNRKLNVNRMSKNGSTYVESLLGGKPEMNKEKASKIVSAMHYINIKKLMKKIKGNSARAKRMRRNLQRAYRMMGKSVQVSLTPKQQARKNYRDRVNKTRNFYKTHRRNRRGQWVKIRHYSKRQKALMKAEGNAKSIKQLDNSLNKLSRGRKTAYTKALIRKETKQRDAMSKQMIKTLEAQMDKLIDQRNYDQQQESYQEQEYSYKEPDANNKVHVEQGKLYWQKKIDQINAQITKLEDQITKISGSIYQNDANSKIDQFNAEIDGDVANIKTIASSQDLSAHPTYAVVTKPTYYFDDYDIANPNERDMAIQPGEPKSNPYHRVLAAYNVTLKSGKNFNMMRATSNDPEDAYSYLLLSRDTKPATPPVKHYNVYEHSEKRYIYITHGEAYEYTKLPSSHLHDHPRIVGVMRMGYRNSQGKRAKIVKSYTFNHSKVPFAYQLSDGNYVKAGSVDVQNAVHLHTARFSDQRIDDAVHGKF